MALHNVVLTPVIFGGGYVKTKAVPSLSEEEEHEYFKTLVEKAKAERAAEAKKIAITYKKTAVATLVHRGVSEPRAIRTVESRLGRNADRAGPVVLRGAWRGDRLCGPG